MIQEQYGLKGIIEYLMQEGSIALLQAVKKKSKQSCKVSKLHGYLQSGKL